uniref:Uncharacterized protein n=1 Tax=Acrobeloides nanus TaxID=290746 RepID=A0A914EK18_9BILA
MNSLNFLVVFVLGSALALSWPWTKHVINQKSPAIIEFDSASGSNWPSVSFSFSLKFTKLQKFFTHIVKSYVDSDILITFFQLPMSQQNCIEHALMENWQNMNDTLDQMMEMCPNASDAIENIYYEVIAEMVEYGQEFMNISDSIPASIQDAIQQLVTATMTLQTENLFQNQTALQELLVPALQNFLQIPQTDLQTLANEYPILAPILTGNDQQSLEILIQSAIDMIENGTTYNEGTIQNAYDQLTQYLKFFVQQILYDIDNATEDNLPSNINHALKQYIGNKIAKCFSKFANFPFLKVTIDQVNDVYEIST